jgi:pimeloyl-ACP methyl ester carboxylesterase
MALLNTFNVANAYLVDFSLGESIGQRVALEPPDQVASLTMFSSSLVGGLVSELDLPTISPERLTKLMNTVPSDWSDPDLVVPFIVEQERFSGISAYPFDKEAVTARAHLAMDRVLNIQSMTNHCPVAFN